MDSPPVGQFTEQSLSDASLLVGPGTPCNNAMAPSLVSMLPFPQHTSDTPFQSPGSSMSQQSQTNRWERNLGATTEVVLDHDDVIKWKHFPRYRPFVRGIHRSPVNPPHKVQWRVALMLSLICALNKQSSKQSWGWWFETPSRSLWHCNDQYLSDKIARCFSWGSNWQVVIVSVNGLVFRGQQAII